MIRSWIMIGAAIALCLAVTAPNVARSQTDLTNLREAIQRNGELLEEAASLVMQTNSSKARASLDAARKLHQYSLALLEQGDSPLLTARVTAKAREAILQTIALAKREARIEEQALAAIERATARLEQARNAFEEYGDERNVAARKFIQEANDQLQRGRNHMREHMFAVALQLANASHALSTRAITMLKRDALTTDFVLREIERTEGTLERVADRAGDGDDRRALAFLDDARSLQQRARASMNAGELRLALEQTTRAREIATRTMRVLDQTAAPERDEVARALQFTDDLIESARDIGGQPAPGLDEALRIQSHAHDEFAGGHNRQAMRLTMRAREILRDAVRAFDHPVAPEAVEEGLARTDDLIARLADAVEATGSDGDAPSLLKRARERQESARAFLASGDTRRALALTRVAASLAREGLHRLGNEER